MSFPSDIIHGFTYSLYVDNSQIYISGPNVTELQVKLSNGLFLVINVFHKHLKFDMVKM